MLKKLILSTAFVPFLALASIPAPTTVSVDMQNLINSKNTIWSFKPQTNEEWFMFKDIMYASGVNATKAVFDNYDIAMQETSIANVPCYILNSNSIKSNGKTLIYIHGGGYVIGGGLSGLTEAAYMAALSGYKIIAIDYRLAPEYKYPYAVDDVFNVYKELLKTTKALDIGVYGTSTGGALTLILAQKAKDNNVPMMKAIAALTPWSDIDKIGDSYLTNENIDNSIVSYEGWIRSAADAYASGFDLKDPYLSPVYGDTQGFCPTLLVSGTRDLFLSNTVRMQQNLIEHNVENELIVYEGQSHAQYYFTFNSKETLAHFNNLIKFFDKHMLQ